MFFHLFEPDRVLLTISQTYWGSRDGADEDNRYRMIPLPAYEPDDIKVPHQMASNSVTLRNVHHPPPYAQIEPDELCPLQARYTL